MWTLRYNSQHKKQDGKNLHNQSHRKPAKLTGIEQNQVISGYSVFTYSSNVSHFIQLFLLMAWHTCSSHDIQHTYGNHDIKYTGLQNPWYQHTCICRLPPAHSVQCHCSLASWCQISNRHMTGTVAHSWGSSPGSFCVHRHRPLAPAIRTKFNFTKTTSVFTYYIHY